MARLRVGLGQETQIVFGAAIAKDIEDRALKAGASALLGKLRTDQDRAEEARAALGWRLAIERDTGSRRGTASTLLLLGALDAAAGRVQESREQFEEASRLATSLGAPELITEAACRLACLPGGDVDEALSAFEAWGDRLEHYARMEASVLLWRATGDATHHARAKGLLDDALANTAEAQRDTMRNAVPLHRTIETGTWTA